MDGVPYPQPLAGPEPQYVPWGVLLVRPIGHPPRQVPPRAADQRSRAYPTFLRVLRWGRYGHRGGPQTPEVGSLACVSRGPFSSRPPFCCAVCGGWCPVSPGRAGGGGGGVSAVPGRVACVRVAPSSGRGLPLVCVFVARCVRAWCLCWFVVRGFLCVVRGGGVSVGLWLVCGVVGPSPLLAEVPVCYSPPLLAGFPCLWWCAVPRHSWLGFRCRPWRVVCGVWCVVCGERRWCVGGVVADVWCGSSLATPGGGSLVLLPAPPGWVSLPVVVGGPRHSWLRSPGGGGVSGVVAGVWCGWSLATPGAGSCVLLPATPGWVSLPVVVCGSPPLLAGACWRRWCVVCGVWCVVCGVRRWCFGWVVARVWCGWSLATPGGGSCVLLPATPGWVSLPAVVGGPRHSWLRAPGAVPRHSWLGSAGGGGVWWGCGWCVVWLVTRQSWRTFLCATPRHSWLGFAAGGGVRFPATPGWGLLAAVVRGVWCVVCGVWCAAVVCWWGCGWFVVWLVPRHSWRRFLCATPCHSWLGFAASGGGRSSPLLAEGSGRGSPPLLAGVRWRRWCAVGLWLVCGVVGPSPLLAEVPACYSPPLLAGFRCRWWCVVSRHSWLGSAHGGGVWCVVCGVWCVVCGGGVLVGLRLVCGVVGSSLLPAEVAVCYSPPLLAGFRCRRWWAFLATPGGGSRARFPATPGWVSLSAVVCGVWCAVCGLWCAAVACVVGLWLVCGVVGPSPVLAEVAVCYPPATPGWASLPVVVWGSPPLLAGARRLWWCVSRAGVSFVVCVCGVCGCARWPCCVVCCVFVVSVFLVVWCGGAVGVSSGCPAPWSWCVCVRCVALRVGVGGVGGGGGSCAVWLPCVCVCVLAVCGWWGGVCHTLAGSLRRSSAWFKKQKKRSRRCVAEMRGMRDA